MSTTLEEHAQVITACKALFDQKRQDYDTSWRILRLPSCTDQILIKAKRIRTIQEKGQQKVSDGIESELIGIVNYGIIALMQLRLNNSSNLALSEDLVSRHYKESVQEIQDLLERKNHDYAEIWRDMRVSSLVDIILMKLMRLKKIEDNAGITLVSEGVKANYQDIVNYAVFALIQGGFLVDKNA